MDTVFIDTNSIRNEKPTSFFGNIDKYQKLADQVQIIIPTIVIEEIKRQKRRYLHSQLDKLRSNYFTTYLGTDTGEILSQHIDEKIEKLYEEANEEIGHVVLDLEPDGKLQRIKELAINNIPPFEAETDKGFKDSLIYLTVLQYQDSAHDDVFIITNDSKLKEAFKDTTIITLSSTEEYYRFKEEYFREDYFVKKIKEYFEDDTITEESVIRIELSEDENWIITIEVNGEEQQVSVDFVSKEII